MNISDRAFPWLHNINSSTYHKYCKNIYSQNGEDGILEQLIKELNITTGTFCEFGASNGITSSNTFNLIMNYGFTGMSIEADKNKYNECVNNYKQYPQIKVFNGYILYNNPEYNLNKWLEKGTMKKDFDILSIDIDGDDYYVWQGLVDYNPKLVIIEVNSYRDPVFDELPKKPCSDYNIDLLKQNAGLSWRVAFGCSFMSAIKLGLEKGYVPVSFTGNLIFVRKDLIHNLKEFPYKLSDNPNDYIHLYSHLSMWENKWFTNNGLLINKAIGDYYLQTKKKYIDISWLNNQVNRILKNIDL